MKENTEHSDCITFFPELLSLEELKVIIKERHPKLPNFKKMTYDIAVSTFRSMIMPLPQRDYPTNTRGRLLQQRRPQSASRAELHSSLTGALKRLPSSDRLKPPPDSSFHAKVHIKPPATASTHLDIHNRSVSTSHTKSHKRNDSSDGNDNDPESKPKRQKITWP